MRHWPELALLVRRVGLVFALAGLAGLAPAVAAERLDPAAAVEAAAGKLLKEKRPAKALPLLRQVVALRRQALKPDDDRIAVGAVELASALSGDLNRHDEAARIVREVLPPFEARGADDPVAVELRYVLAETFLRLDRYDDALALIDINLAVLRAGSGHADAAVVESLAIHADALRRASRPGQAVVELRDVYAVRRRTGDYSAYRAAAELAEALLETGDVAAAESALIEFWSEDMRADAATFSPITLDKLVGIAVGGGEPDRVERWLLDQAGILGGKADAGRLLENIADALAKLYRQTGRREDAEQALAMAQGLARRDAGVGELRRSTDKLAGSIDGYLLKGDQMSAGPLAADWVEAVATQAYWRDDGIRRTLRSFGRQCFSSQPDEARVWVPFCRRLVDVVVTMDGADSDKAVDALNRLGGLMVAAGDPAGALAPLGRARAIAEARSTVAGDNYAAVMGNIVRALHKSGRAAEALTLAEARAAQGGEDEVKDLLRLARDIDRELGTLETARQRFEYDLGYAPAGNSDLVFAADRLRHALIEAGRRDDAMDMLQRLAMAQRQNGADGYMATSLSLLADLLEQGGRKDEAAAARREAGEADAAANARTALTRRAAEQDRRLEIERKLALPPENIAEAWDQASLVNQDDPDHAEAILQPFLDAAMQRGPASNAALQALFYLQLANRFARPLRALDWSRQAVARLTEPALAGAWQLDARPHYYRHVAMISRLLDRPDAPPGLIGEAFTVAQRAGNQDVAGTLQKAMVRLADGAGPFAALLKARVGAEEKLRALVVEHVEENPAAVAAALRQRAELVRERDALDRQLAAIFPERTATLAGKPVDLDEAQKLLRPDEALLLYLIDTQSFAIVVRPDGVRLVPLEIGAPDMLREVAVLRRNLDHDVNGDLAPYPADRAYALYRQLIEPLHLPEQVRHLLVVPDGGLGGFPLGALVTAAPSGADPGGFEWLAKRFAVSVLPSTAALHALRRVSPRSAAREPFLGVGNPVLSGVGESRGGGARLFRGALADVNEVRQLPALPDSADELMRIANALHAPGDALLLGPGASETKIKAAALDRYRVVAFATHALLAGELGDNLEPALVLSPPQMATAGDDGLLTASEIAALSLDADLVILSACNTGGSDGTPDGTAMSGLARAFFTAGARSLLVSHWPVASKAAVRLTTRMFAFMTEDGAMGRAEALRRSMTEFVADETVAPEFRHPMFWAAFSLVGEGARPE